MAGGFAAALEAIEAAVELRIREHRLDGFLSSSVERFAEFGLQDGAHEYVGTAVPAWPGAFAFVGVGWDENRDALADDLLHLLLVPVAGVGDDHAGLLGDASRFEFLQCRVDHWAEMPEVGAGVDLSGDHDLVLVDDRLAVVALDIAARCLEVLGVRVGHVHFAGRGRGRRVGLRAVVMKSPTGLVDTARAVGLVVSIRALLRPELFLQPPLGLLHSRGPRLRHRLGIGVALCLEPLLRFAQPGAAALSGREFGRQLVTAPLTVELVLGRIDRLGLLEDLTRELLVIAVRVVRRVSRAPSSHRPRAPQRPPAPRRRRA